MKYRKDMPHLLTKPCSRGEESHSIRTSTQTFRPIHAYWFFSPICHGQLFQIGSSTIPSLCGPRLYILSKHFNWSQPHNIFECVIFHASNWYYAPQFDKYVQSYIFKSGTNKISIIKIPILRVSRDVAHMGTLYPRILWPINSAHFTAHFTTSLMISKILMCAISKLST